MLLLERTIFRDLSNRCDLIVHGMHPLLKGQHSVVHFLVDLPLGTPHLLIENLNPFLVPTLQLDDFFTFKQSCLDICELLILGDVRLDCNIM